MPPPRRSLASWLLIVALVVVGGITLWQGSRTVRNFVFFRIHQDEPIQPWMRIGFVAHSYHVPPFVLHRALGLPDWPPDHRPLARIAAAKGMSFATAKARLMDAIVHARPPFPPPAPPTPLPGQPHP